MMENYFKIFPVGVIKHRDQSVFATRSPVRPNPIAPFSCQIIAIKGRIIYIESIDAFDGSPVLDIKPYIPRIDSISKARGPELKKPVSPRR